MGIVIPCPLLPPMLSAPLKTELQLRGNGGDTEGCAPGCQAELPLPTKLHYLGLAPWLPQRPQGSAGTQGHGSQLLAASVKPETCPDRSQVPPLLVWTQPCFQLLSPIPQPCPTNS